MAGIGVDQVLAYVHSLGSANRMRLRLEWRWGYLLPCGLPLAQVLGRAVHGSRVSWCSIGCGRCSSGACPDRSTGGSYGFSRPCSRPSPSGSRRPWTRCVGPANGSNSRPRPSVWMFASVATPSFASRSAHIQRVLAIPDGYACRGRRYPGFSPCA